jgi:hypothetical protein
MMKNPVMAYEPEAVLDEWYKYASKGQVEIGAVVGQIIPGKSFVWEIVKGKPFLAIVEDIYIMEASNADYDEVIKAIAGGQFQITSTDRLGEKTVLHKATGFPLKPPCRDKYAEDEPSL